MQVEQYSIYKIDLTIGTVKDDELEENILNAVILSPNEMNECLKSVIMAPITTCEDSSITPTTFYIDKNIKIRLDQISSIAKKRIVKRVGSVDTSQIPKIKNVLNEMLVK